MKKQTKKQQSGRSMIEMVGVLAVMGLITAAAFVLINSAMSSQRLSRVDDDVAGIVNGVRLLYNSQPDFTGVSADTLVLLGFGNADKAYQNPYGGDYILNSQPNARTFTVTLDKLGAKTCTVLSTKTWTAGGKVITTAVESSPVTSCTATTTNTNKVVIQYGKADSSMNP
ncbi:MAG: hypothetical protein J6W27_03865 [Alphaproteobacteria bacterium]|nr:hypothetical protein [Alphaproteobacteria bacterium]